MQQGSRSDDGVRSRRRRVWWWVTLSLGAVLLILLLPAIPWLRTEAIIRKVLADPTVELSRPEVRQIEGYIEGRVLCRVPFVGISAGRQRALGQAAVERAVSGKGYVLSVVTAGYKLFGLFPELPAQAARAVNEGARNSDDLILVLEIGAPGSMQGLVDLEEVLLHANDRMLIAVVTEFLVSGETLPRQQATWIEWLGRSDVPKQWKYKLLKRVADVEGGALMFEGHDALLEELARQDPEARMAIDAIRSDLATMR